MKRKLVLLSTLLTLVVALYSCGGGGAKAARALQKVVTNKSAGKAVKGILRNSDDVIRHTSIKTVTCTTCAGLKEVDFVDENGNYVYTGTCPECDGKVTVTKYEFN